MQRRRQQLLVVLSALVVGVGFGSAGASGTGDGGRTGGGAEAEQSVEATVASVRALSATAAVVVELAPATPTTLGSSTITTFPPEATSPDAPRSTTTATIEPVRAVSTSESTTTTTASRSTTTTTEPEPEPEPAPSGGGSVEAAIARWFPGQEAKASDVAWCESSHDPEAVSAGGGNHGLFQINRVHRADFVAVTGVSWEAGIYDPDLNARFAAWLHDREGWAPWACA